MKITIELDDEMYFRMKKLAEGWYQREPSESALETQAYMSLCIGVFEEERRGSVVQRIYEKSVS